MLSSTILTRIAKYNTGRDPARLALKFRAMRADPFRFFRGSAHLFWEDWAAANEKPDPGPLAWSCGDLHLENFGSFLGDNRLVYFDLNDFDESALAPAACDVTRLLTSAHLAARSIGITPGETSELIDTFLGAYRTALSEGKARWIERATATGMVRDLLCAAHRRSRDELLNARTTIKRGHRRLKVDDKRIAAASSADARAVTAAIEEYASEVESRRDTPSAEFYRVLDVGVRIAGTGSLGLRRYIVLVCGTGGIDGNYLLDVKEAKASSMAVHLAVPQPRWRNEAERIVAIQTRVQAASPALLSAMHVGGKPFVLKELQPSEDRLSLESARGKLKRLRKTARAMARSLAWGQLRSASRQGAAGLDELIDFGRRAAWGRDAARYAARYAEIVEENWNEFSS